MTKNRQVILIMTDTTRKDMLGCYGDKRMVTPNLDKMAEKGIRYERAYCTQPVCGPARSSIFTGLYPHSNSVVANSLPLGANVKTIGQRLTDSGIPCAYIGKYHLDGGDYFGLGKCPDGWDEKYWYDMRCYLEEMDEEDRKKSRKIDTSFEGLEEGFTYAEKCTKKAIQYLEEHNGEDSFFLTLSYDEPHGPSLCPAPFCHMYDEVKAKPNPNLVDTLEGKPQFQKVWGAKNLNKPMEEMQELSLKQKMLYSCNSFVDSLIGQVLTLIKEKFPDAMVIFTSDHGDAMGAHRLTAKGASIYEEICNIPLIITAPGCKASVNHSCVSHVDLVPTILDWFERPVPVLLEGKSLKQQILGSQNAVQDYVFIEFTRYETDHDGFGGLQMMRGIISDRYKMAVHLLDSDELYDNHTDAEEMNNLIESSEYSELRDRLHDLILEHMNKTRDPYRGYQWKMRPYRKFSDSVTWDLDGYTRQRENEEYEPRQLDYGTGLPMTESVRKKV